jgi:hypothetical protein
MYELFNIETGEVLTTCENNTTVFGGFWGELQSQGKTAWREIAVPANAEIKKQIMVLESLQTPRRVREAMLGTDNGWLTSLETQIAALRAQLK